MASYLTADEAIDRLIDRAEIEATITPLDVEAASAELDALAPFIGAKYDTSGAQELAFPRSINPDGTEADDVVPVAVLDRVALTALRLSTSGTPSSVAITSETIGNTSRTYATPRAPRVDSLLETSLNALQPYLLKVGQRVGVSGAVWRTHESYPDYPLG